MRQWYKISLIINIIFILLMGYKLYHFWEFENDGEIGSTYFLIRTIPFALYYLIPLGLIIFITKKSKQPLHNKNYLFKIWITLFTVPLIVLLILNLP